MEPARTIVKKFGGPTILSELLGVHRTRVSNWMRPREAKGTGGIIPQRYHPKLLEHARANAIELKAEDFLPVEQSSGTAPSAPASEPAGASS